MSTYEYRHHQSTSDWNRHSQNEFEDWSDTPSLSFSTNTNSPSDYLEDLPTPSYKFKCSKMEDDWRNTPLPESPICTSDMGSIAPHGLGGHRRGPSELEATIWDTAQVNGELGLAPVMSMDAKSAAGLLPSSDHITAKSTGRSGPAPLPIAVWAKIMDTSKGRDKVLVSLGSCDKKIGEGQLMGRNAYNTH
jgi:hypothetical protein